MSQTRYILDQVIARGGMAEIYLAKALGADNFARICAVKKILSHYADDPEYIKMFREEARISRSLQHANIVQVFDFQKFDDSYALIMEFVAGTDMRALLAACEKARMRLTVPMAVYVVAQAARGLHYAHTKTDEQTGRPLNIIHRDMSPQNILISYEAEVKITDFGIAKFEATLTETKPGVVKGKYSYMSPEQVSGNKSLDARTDIFSLAVVLWEALAMKRLFAAESELETIKRVQDCRITRPLFELNNQVDHHLQKIINKALSKDRRKRYQTAQEFEHDLINYLNTRHRQFTPSELASFVKQIFSRQRHELLQRIRHLLNETNAQTLDGSITLDDLEQCEPTLTAVDDRSSAQSNSLVLNLSTEQSASYDALNVKHQQKHVVGSSVAGSQDLGLLNQAPSNSFQKNVFSLSRGSNASTFGRHHRASYRKSALGQRGYLYATKTLDTRMLWGFGIVFVLLLMGLLSYHFFKKNRTSPSAVRAVELYLTAQPRRLKLTINGKALNNGDYINLPKKILLPAGSYTMKLEHKYYHSKILSFEGIIGDYFAPKDLNLQPRQGLVWVPMTVTTADRKINYVRIDQGLIEGRVPLNIPAIAAQQSYILDAYSWVQGKKHLLVQCRFVPRVPRQGGQYELRIIQTNDSTQPYRCMESF